MVTMRWKNFYIGRAQRVAAALLLVMLGECLWLVARSPLTTQEYRYARCGREMWERPTPVQGYFTTCGNLQGDGTFAYRLAGLPLTVERWVLLAGDHFRKPEDKLYQGGVLDGSTWEARHQLSAVKYLLRLPFVMFALWLGGGLWWVSRRLFGNAGGAIALALYIFCPAVLRYASAPNNEILAMWGLYGLVYTAIGVAHAMYGPRRKWRPRIALLTVAMAMTAAAHVLAGLLGLLAGTLFLFYLAERRRSYASQIVVFSSLGALLLLFAAFAFRTSAFLYVFSGGSARFWFSMEGLRTFVGASSALHWMGGAVLPLHGPIVLGVLLALGIYVSSGRSRYFGNTTPLLMTLLLVPLYTTQTMSAPWFWALPFVFTFVGGVAADALESRRKKLALMATLGLVLTQAAVCVSWLTSV